MFGRRKMDVKINDDGTVTVAGPCIITKEPYSVTVPEQGYRLWVTGNVLIQKAFPTLSHEDREFLISGTSPKGWKQMFGME